MTIFTPTPQRSATIKYLLLIENPLATFTDVINIIHKRKKVGPLIAIVFLKKYIIKLDHQFSNPNILELQ